MICHPERSGLQSAAFAGWVERGICSLPITKRNINRMARKLANTDGAEIAEAALVLPLVFMILLGIVWFGRAFNIYSTIQQAAQQGAITAARPTCATCSGGNTFPLDGTVTGAVETVMKSSNLDTTQILPNPNPAAPVFCANPPNTCSTTDNITVCRNVLLNPPASATQLPQCGTIVSFQYPFQFYLPFTSLNLQKIILSAQAQSRMEN
jgi:Flp pilus assembly protein TadG